jgi:F-type H+-transporting ATPase subunit epsilon
MAGATHKADLVHENFAPQHTPEVPPGDELWVEIRSPDGQIWSGIAESVVVPATKGSMGVLPKHAPLMSSLEVGLTRVREPNKTEHAFVTGGGFVEVNGNRVLLLVDFGDRPEDIDTARAEAARERAKERLRSREEEIDRVRAEAALQRAIRRLMYAGKPRI